ncbi:hypothetical protein SISNIDRAFT_463376 [Sistotremastrum niveocremeum HHB9708]|uniref:DUF4100 domain-containing protein n=1 Tax=Sistotremastrum niveocremeum HHB9708 TaxID=1314777 RepID=A0A164Y5D1_9AGAM|nr:hypothetical protein SISNIDRAFT_463376 [Sistotremastrum niveocremeum HHB9708]
MVSAVSRMLAEETGLADVGIITAVPGTATTSDESTSILATGVVEPPKKKTRFEGVEILKNPMHPNRYPPEAMTDDDVIMEDPAITAAKKRKNPPTPSTSTPRPTRTDEATTQSRSALQSEVQRQTNPTEVVKRVLESPITLPLREFLGVSPSSAKQVTDLLRLTRIHSGPSSNVAAVEVDADTSSSSVAGLTLIKTRPRVLHEQHIRIPVQIYGRPLMATIDPGSQVDLMSQDTFNQLSLLLQKDHPMKIRGVNKGQAGLMPTSGVAMDVPVMIGAIRTQAHFFVGDSSITVILGRPWMRANMVSLDERLDGTFVVFKNSVNGEVIGELNSLPPERIKFWREYYEAGANREEGEEEDDEVEAALQEAVVGVLTVDGVGESEANDEDDVGSAAADVAEEPPAESRDERTEPEPAILIVSIVPEPDAGAPEIYPETTVPVVAENLAESSQSGNPHGEPAERFSLPFFVPEGWHNHHNPNRESARTRSVSRNSALTLRNPSPHHSHSNEVQPPPYPANSRGRGRNRRGRNRRPIQEMPHRPVETNPLPPTIPNMENNNSGRSTNPFRDLLEAQGSGAMSSTRSTNGALNGAKRSHFSAILASIPYLVILAQSILLFFAYFRNQSILGTVAPTKPWVESPFASLLGSAIRSLIESLSHLTLPILHFVTSYFTAFLIHPLTGLAARHSIYLAIVLRFQHLLRYFHIQIEDVLWHYRYAPHRIREFRPRGAFGVQHNPAMIRRSFAILVDTYHFSELHTEWILMIRDRYFPLRNIN